MTRKQIMEELRKNGVEFNSKAKLAELEELYLTINKGEEEFEEGDLIVALELNEIEEPKLTVGEAKKLKNEIVALMKVRRHKNVEAKINELTDKLKAGR